MGKKTESGTDSAHILVITDRQRLLGLFDFCRDAPAVRLSKVSSIDEGMKIAAKNPPRFLFVQSRMGGFSGEIIARHIRLELKNRGTRIVFFCDPEDMPPPGSKSFFAALDTSLSDDLLAEQVRSVLGSCLPEEKREPAGKKKTPARNVTADSSPESASAPVRETEGLAGGINDIVEIRTNGTNPVRPDEMPGSPQARAPESCFREKLDRALEKSVPASAANDAPDPMRGIPEQCPGFSGTREPETGEPTGPAIPPRTKGRRTRLIVISVAILSGVALLVLFRAAPSPPEKTAQTDPLASVKESGEALKAVPETSPGETNAGGLPGSTGPTRAEDRKSAETASKAPTETHVKYTVRPGDTVFTILTKRFGLSARMAHNLIPEVLEKNGISRDTVLTVGREILIPATVKILPAPGS